MKKLSLLVTLVLVNLLHPTVTFAMDSKMIAKATKEIAKDIEKLSEDEQNFGSELDGSVKGRGGSSQQAFPSSSSRSGGSSFATLLGPSATVTDFASSSSLSGLNAPSFPNTRGDSIKIVQNLDDLRTSIGQIIKSTLDKENRTLAQTDFCDNKLTNIQIITAARVASRIASRISFGLNPAIYEYIDEYISEYIDEYNKASEHGSKEIDCSSTTIKSIEDARSWDAILNAQQDAVKDTLESKDLNIHKNYLKDVLGINLNINKGGKVRSQKTLKKPSNEAAKDARQDALRDVSQDQEHFRISFRNQWDANYVHQYIADYACKYAEEASKDTNQSFSYNEWINIWSSIYEKVIGIEKGIIEEEGRDSMATTTSDADTRSINSFFDKASECEDNSDNSVSDSDDSEHKITDDVTAREKMLALAKKFVNWKEKTLVPSVARNNAKIVLNKKKDYYESLLFKEADKAWNAHQDEQAAGFNTWISIGKAKGAKYDARLSEAYNKAQLAEHSAREKYLNCIITEVQNAKTTGPHAFCIESALSEIFWKSKNQKKVKFAQSNANNKETRKEALEKFDNTVFKIVWPEALQEEIAREVRIHQIKTQAFDNTDQAWATYIQLSQEDNKESKEKTLTDVQALELEARETYKNAVMAEALDATHSVHSRAAEGAWAVRAETSAEAVTKAVKDKIQSEENALKAMILSVAPWTSSNTLKFICDNSEIKNGLIEAAELTISNAANEDNWRKKVAEEIPHSLEVAWKKEHGDLTVFAQTEDGKKIRAARKTTETAYRNATNNVERAISIAEADLSAWKNAWPKEYQKNEAAKALLYKNYEIAKLNLELAETNAEALSYCDESRNNDLFSKLEVWKEAYEAFVYDKNSCQKTSNITQEELIAAREEASKKLETKRESLFIAEELKSAITSECQDLLSARQATLKANQAEENLKSDALSGAGFDEHTKSIMNEYSRTAVEAMIFGKKDDINSMERERIRTENIRKIWLQLTAKLPSSEKHHYNIYESIFSLAQDNNIREDDFLLTYRASFKEFIRAKKDFIIAKVDKDVLENTEVFKTTGANLKDQEAACSSLKSDAEELSMSQRATLALEKSKNALAKALESEQAKKKKTAHIWRVIAEDLEAAAKHWQDAHGYYVSENTSDNQEKRKNSEVSAVIIETGVQDLIKHVESLDQPKKMDQNTELCLYVNESGKSQFGGKRVIKIIKKNLEYPYIRVEQEYNHDGQLMREVSSVADHLLVELAANENAENFIKNWPDLNVWLEEVPFSKSRYLLHFLPKDFQDNNASTLELLNIMTEIENKLKTLKVHYEHNFLFSLSSDRNNNSHASKKWDNLGLPHGINVPANVFTTESFLQRNHPVTVAVCDTGIDFHHDALQKNCWKGKDDENRAIYCYDATTQYSPEYPRLAFVTCDDNDGHGTHVAGIIGAIKVEDPDVDGVNGVVSVAGMVCLMPCKMSSDSKNVFYNKMLSCIEFAIKHKAKILNCSWGFPYYNMQNLNNVTRKELKTLKDALMVAKENDMIIVASAGNNQTSNDEIAYYPACFQNLNIVAVAATDRNGDFGVWEGEGGGREGSNFGQNVHLTAPGVDIYSTIPEEEGGDSYDFMTGTSMAAPHLTGALVVIMNKYPDENCSFYLRKLKDSASPFSISSNFTDNMVSRTSDTFRGTKPIHSIFYKLSYNKLFISILSYESSSDFLELFNELRNLILVGFLAK